MATTIPKYVAKCRELVDAKPKYVRGKSSLEECDCIGQDKYAFRECGVKLSTTGTNHTARKQVVGLRPIVGTGDLAIGDVVFKVRNPGEKGYALKDKYKPGGSEYNGDLHDYYHIGTVESVYPLRILHMTDPTAKIDKSIGKWAYVASWDERYIERETSAPAPDPEPDPDPLAEPVPIPEPVPEYATVWSENGKAVNLRARESRASALIERVPVDSTVEILSRGEEWSRIRWGRYSGYMMNEYLIFPENVLYTVTIPHLTYDHALALTDGNPGAYMIEEKG